MEKKFFVVLNFTEDSKNLLDFFTDEFPNMTRRIMVGIKINREVVCSAILAIHKDAAHIDYILTAKSHRKQGLAKELLEHILTNTPYKNLKCYIRDTNIPSIKLFESCGFKFMNFHETSYNNGDKKLVYGKFT